MPPELAPKEDPRHWVMHNTRAITKPGDTVLVHYVMGEKFGDDKFMPLIGKHATFLGLYDDNPEGFLDTYKQLIGERADQLGPDEVDSITRVAYFTGKFEGVGRVVFNTYECAWTPLNPDFTN